MVLLYEPPLRADACVMTSGATFHRTAAGGTGFGGRISGFASCETGVELAERHARALRNFNKTHTHPRLAPPDLTMRIVRLNAVVLCCWGQNCGHVGCRSPCCTFLATRRRQISPTTARVSANAASIGPSLVDCLPPIGTAWTLSIPPSTALILLAITSLVGTLIPH